MDRKPTPPEHIWDEGDLPRGCGWRLPALIESLEKGAPPEGFQAFFERDPERRAPSEPGLVVAPADGLLELRRRPGLDPEFLIHLRLTDVHVQRVPLAGVVRGVARAGSGFFYPDDEGYWGGVRAITTVDSACGAYTVTQLTTLITRRIETWLRPGQRASTGERLGRIRMGSTVILALPGRWEALARDGQRVYAGETVLARLP